MIGKLLIEFLLPATIILIVAWQVYKHWYFKWFPKTIKVQQQLRTAGERYDAALAKRRPIPRNTKQKGEYVQGIFSPRTLLDTLVLSPIGDPQAQQLYTKVRAAMDAGAVSVSLNSEELEYYVNLLDTLNQKDQA